MEELEQEELDEQLLAVGPSAVELPNPPVAEPSRPGTVSKLISFYVSINAINFIVK